MLSKRGGLPPRGGLSRRGLRMLSARGSGVHFGDERVSWSSFKDSLRPIKLLMGGDSA